MRHALFRLLNDTISNPVFDTIVPIFSDKNLVIIPGFVAVLLLVHFGRRYTRTCILALVIALLLADVGTARVFKSMFQIERPYYTVEDTRMFRHGQWIQTSPSWGKLLPESDPSFPSSHAANTAAVTVVLAVLHGKTVWVMAPLTLLIGFSRIYTGRHFPIDVLAGFGWGMFSGWLALKASFWGVQRFWGPPRPDIAPPTPPPPERLAFYGILAGWTALNFAFVVLNLFDLAGDEAQYWEWSRRLDWSYYSKPPLIAYVIAILTSTSGDQEWAIRSGAVLFSSGGLALLYGLTRRIAQNERAALIAVMAMIAMPALWAGSVIMTIDPLLVFFWTLALYGFHRAVAGDRGMWALTGLALGLGLLSKYTMVLLLPTFALYLVLVDRKWLRTAGPWLALALAAVLQAGVVYWNWSHNWVSFRHTAAIGAAEGFSILQALGRFIEFFGAQAGIVSPILFGFMLWAWWRCLRRFRESPDAAYLSLAFGVLFCFYAVVSFTHSPQPNWPMAAYPAAAVALGWVWTQEQRPRWQRRLLVGGLVLGCVVGVAARSTDLLYMMGREPRPGERADRIYLPAGIRIDPAHDPTNKLRGGRELGETLSLYFADVPGAPFLVSNRYQITALMAFYTPGMPKAYCFPFGRRWNQYDIWGGWEALEGRDALYVTGGDAEQAEQWIAVMLSAGLFEEGEFLDKVEVTRGHTLVQTYSISRMRTYSGADMKPEDQY